MKNKASRVAFNGLLSAFAIAITTVESFLPPTALLPPGIKIGFSNVAVMMAAKNLSFSSAIFISLIKSFYVLATRGFYAFVLSLSGGVASTLVVILVFGDKKGRFGCVGAGLIGAQTHNLAQVAVYSLMIGRAAFYYLPVLSVFGVASGALTGLTLYFSERALKVFNLDKLKSNSAVWRRHHRKEKQKNG